MRAGRGRRRRPRQALLLVPISTQPTKFGTQEAFLLFGHRMYTTGGNVDKAFQITIILSKGM